MPAYESRHVRTFGFYEGRATVHSEDGWFHILPDGNPLYGQRYAWCGNFQEGRCTVRLPGGDYFHITSDGSAAYSGCYRYAGDFKDGYAVVQRHDGKHSHIDAYGNLLHGRWFRDLDVFHKGYARACDSDGWHHVDMIGEPLYAERFKHVEPFYNGEARVEGLDGSLSVVDESGQTLLELRTPSQSHLERLSADMVGLWRTQTIRAAVALGVFEFLPACAKEIERQTRLHSSIGIRLMRGLMELGLVLRDAEGIYHATERGSFLMQRHPLSLAHAARHWGRESHEAWSALIRSLRTGESGFENMHGKNFFDWMQDRPADLQTYHSAMSTYARHDYGGLADAVDYTIHDSVLDAGGGAGELVFALLRSCPRLQATVMDRAEVVEAARPPTDLEGRCRFVAGDLFQQWPVKSDAIILARVLHDWPDSRALRILRRARETTSKGSMLYVIEMVLDDSTGGGGLMDLNMLVMTQGAERTEEQFRDLLAQAGFGMLDVIKTGSVSSVIRARAL
ncbi:MAG: methyltransferase [Dehalococcoidia bacterium]|nr:methyltransferase [Dehalococcoidia bacterium]